MQDESMKSAESELDEERRLDARVVRVLERVAEVKISADFAARVAGLVPARRVMRESVRTTRIGYWVMAVSLVVLVAAMVLVAASRSHGTVGVLVEWTLCGEFVGLAMWLSIWRWRSGDAS